MKFHRYNKKLLKVLGLALLLTQLPEAKSAPPGPPLRSGLWVTQKLPDNDAAVQEFASLLGASRDLSGVCLHIAWNQIQPRSGPPEFRFLDRSIALLHQAGLKYQLCLKPGTSTPAFVYAEGAASFETTVPNPHRANFGAPVKVPVPWDPVFKRDFAEIINRLGQKYAGDPLCVSVVLTCANFMSAEMHLPKSSSDLAHWRALGDYQAKLFDVYKEFTDVWGKAFPNQEISLHLTKVLNLSPSFCERIIDYGIEKYPGRFSIQNCQLTGRKEDYGMMTYDLIQQYRDRVHHGFQSLARLNGPDGRMGTPEMAALNLVHAKAEFWELWHGEGFDPKVAIHANKVWQEARQLGYDGYKKKLIADGNYRTRR
jgi:hypothetical protein